MIVVDTSALVAIQFAEPERPTFLKRIAEDGRARISAASYLETSMICEGRHGVVGRALLETLFARLIEAGVEVVPFDQAQADLARDAFRRYGRGRHPAKLNFGDCMAYALAMSLSAPLLFKGNDFRLTDVAPACP
jgi:ribonuclease VapC